MPVICDLYCRVSTAEQASEGYSLGEQEARLRAYAAAQGWVINDVIVDGGFSGAKLDRPGIQKVIQDAETGRINLVATYKLDRLSRSQKDTLYLIEDVFLAHGVDYVSMTESFNSSTPFGKATLGLLSVFAQLERDQIKERMMMGKQAIVRSGKYFATGQSCPIGYTYHAKKDGGDATLEILPDEAEMVRYIFDLFQAGYTYRAIYRKICERFPDRSKITAHTTVKNVLSNRIYIGQFLHSGEYYASKDIPPIIDEETFWRVQRKMIEYQEARDNSISKPVRETSHPLSGFLWCGCCGKRFQFRSSRKKRVDGSINYSEFFDCRSKYQGTGDSCHQPRIKAEILESAIWSQLEALRFGDLQLSAPDHTDEIQELHKKIGSIDHRIEKLIDLYSIGSIDFSQIEKRTAELKAQKIRLLDQIRSLETDAADQDPEILRTAIDKIHEIHLYGSDEDKRDLYRLLLKRVVIGPGSQISIELTV